MDDLERAILVMFDESGALDDDLKKQAKVYCNDIKEKPLICRLCIEKLCFSNLVQVQFWCLQTLHEVIRTRYLTMTPDERHMIRGSVFSIVCLEDKNLARVLEGPAFIKNKLAQVLITLIYFEYPLVWSSVFVDFFPHLSKGNVVIDMFCRVLNALDDELISLDYPRTPEELAVAGRVKDAMRQQCVPQIVRVWYDIVSMYRNSDHELCTSVLDSMRRYISWIDIGLIVNDAFIPLLFDLILVGPLSDQLRGASVRCLLAVVSKRMEPESKLSLLQSLQISRVLRLVTEDVDVELVSDIAALLSGYAVEALDCFKRINSEDAKGISMELLSEVLPSIFYVMKNFEVDVTFNIIQFLSGYVAIFKSFVPLPEKQLLHLGQILEVILVLIRYDPVHRTNLDVMDKIGKEEEDRMVEFRKDLFVLLRNVGRVAPDVTQLFIRNSLASAVSRSSDSNVEEVEGALSLLYALGESISEEAIRTGSGLLSELVLMLLSTKFPCHSNRLVALVYLETVTRYIKFIQDNTQYIPMVLAAFLDERGIHHSNINVSRRASYLFMRVVKFLKMKLVPFIETILQSLQDTVAQFTIMNYTTEELSGSEDGSHIFEAIGLLIGTEDVLPEKQSDYLSSLLSPLCQQVEALLINAKLLNAEETNAKIAVIQQIIMAINSLSKGFSERLVTASRPAIGIMFKQTLDVLLQVLVIFPKVEPLRNKPKQMVGFLLLLNQLICKFNTLVRDILEEIFPSIAERIFSVIPRNGLPSSGSDAITEEIRELQELQRTLYTFLHVITTHDLSPVFLSPKCKAYLDPVMQLLLYSSCNHNDILVRKACVQIFIRLIKDWCAQPYEEKVPGFRSFVIEAFATNCCLYSVLDRSFEFHDANTFVLFGEIVLAQKVMYEKFGDDFLVNFVSKGFSSAHCPPDQAEQYRQKLQGGDFKALKSFYQSLVENLRVQQNGSLVFR
ncbi:exportin-T-like isoform X2 [Glycine soja]|uniref:exportin-T-like isoform X2 n=1 Tax=Glycine soja TaxID=3848 RepID=UPI00103CED4E|nr:exportin-T-like isoform X2 [Glycine soja]